MRSLQQSFCGEYKCTPQPHLLFMITGEMQIEFLLPAPLLSYLLVARNNSFTSLRPLEDKQWVLKTLWNLLLTLWS